MVNMLFIELQSETAFKETHKNPINGQNTQQINLSLPGNRFLFIFQKDPDFWTGGALFRACVPVLSTHLHLARTLRRGWGPAAVMLRAGTQPAPARPAPRAFKAKPEGQRKVLVMPSSAPRHICLLSQAAGSWENPPAAAQKPPTKPCPPARPGPSSQPRSPGERSRFQPYSSVRAFRKEPKSGSCFSFFLTRKKVTAGFDGCTVLNKQPNIYSPISSFSDSPSAQEGKTKSLWKIKAISALTKQVPGLRSSLCHTEIYFRSYEI